MRRRIMLGLMLWASLLISLVLGLWLGGGCSIRSIIAKRPPVMLHTAGVYRPGGGPTIDPWNFYARVTVPTRPVGVWADLLYNPDAGKIQATTFGVSILFPAVKTNLGEEEIEELILKDFEPLLPPSH